MTYYIPTYLKYTWVDIHINIYIPRFEYNLNLLLDVYINKYDNNIKNWYARFKMFIFKAEKRKWIFINNKIQERRIIKYYIYTGFTSIYLCIICSIFFCLLLYSNGIFNVNRNRRMYQTFCFILDTYVYRSGRPFVIRQQKKIIDAYTRTYKRMPHYNLTFYPFFLLLFISSLPYGLLLLINIVYM